MLASDSSWSNIASISATLPGGFSSLWVNQEKTRIGNQLRRSDADNRAIGGTLNLNSLWSKLGTFSISYNDDRRYNSHYYTADYYQSVYSGTFGSLGLRAGIQRYNNGDSSANTGKYIALDLSLPLGNWFSAGMTHQTATPWQTCQHANSLMKEPFALLVPICHEPSPAIPVMTKPSAVGRMHSSTLVTPAER